MAERTTSREARPRFWGCVGLRCEGHKLAQRGSPHAIFGFGTPARPVRGVPRPQHSPFHSPLHSRRCRIVADGTCKYVHSIDSCCGPQPQARADRDGIVIPNPFITRFIHAGFLIKLHASRMSVRVLGAASLFRLMRRALKGAPWNLGPLHSSPLDHSGCLLLSGRTMVPTDSRSMLRPLITI